MSNLDFGKKIALHINSEKYLKLEIVAKAHKLSVQELVLLLCNQFLKQEFHKYKKA